MKLLRSILFDKRILWIVAVVIAIVLMIDFNSRMTEMLRLNEEKEKASLHVTNLASTEYALRTQIAYATSDLAVEQWAREEGHLIREGEVPIVPLPPAGATPEPQVTEPPAPEPVQNWQVWQALFFGR